MNIIWLLTPVLVGIYCVIQAVRDYRRGNHVLAAIGAACVVLLLTLPIESNVIKLDLPAPEAR